MSVLAAAIGCAPIAAGAQSEQSPSEFPGEPAAYLALVEGESVGEGEGAGEGESAGFGEGDGADEIEIASAGEIEGAGESEGEGSSSGDGDGAPAGRIAYWPFDENGGATAADVVGGATAAISAGAWREGRYGSAIGFAEFGGAARINAPGGALDRLGELSMGMWIRAEPAPGQTRTMLFATEWDGASYSVDNSEHALMWSLNWNPDDYAASRMSVGILGNRSPADPTWGASESGPLGLDIRGGWHYVSFSYSAADMQASFYLDGEPVGSYSYSAAGYADLGISNIGHWNWDYPTDESYIGALDELSIFGRALDGDEMRALSAAPGYSGGGEEGGGDGAPAGRIAYWPFDENGGAVAEDVVGGIAASIAAGSWREGRYGSAIGFAEFGGAARINAPGGALDRLGELSMGMWIRAEPAPGQTRTMLFATEWDGASYSVGDSEHALMWALNWNTGDYAASRMSVGVLGSQSPADPTYGASESGPLGLDIRGGWHYVSFSYSAVERQASFYLDGEPVGSYSYSAAVYADLGISNIGHWNWDYPTDESYIGALDELSIFGRALDGDEMRILSAAPGHSGGGDDGGGDGTVGDNIYYVDQALGDDAAGDGSAESPWATIGRAASAMLPGDTCRIRTGVYRETVAPARSGTEERPMVFEADSGAVVTVSGAEIIEGGWTAYEGAEAAYKASAILPMAPYLNQIYVDGEAMMLARYPNAPFEGARYAPNFLTADDGSSGGWTQSGGAIVDAELTQPDGYWDGAAALMIDSYGWCLSGAVGTSYTQGRLNLSGGNVYEIGKGSRYYLVGKLSELDSPGEWHYDAAGGTVYLRAPDSASPEGRLVEYKARDLAIDLRNKKHVQFRGIDLFAATIDASGGEGCLIDGMVAKYVSDFYVPVAGKAGILLGGRGNRLQNSEIAYSSGALVAIEGEGNSLVNNVIHDGTYGPTLSESIISVSGQGHLISRNTAYNASREIFGGKFRASEVSYNDFHHGNYIGVDTGLLYLAWADYGDTRIHHNYFHDSIQSFSNGTYFDLNVKNVLLHNNVYWNLPWTGFFVNSSSEFVSAVNNTFYNVAQGTGAPEAYLSSPSDAYMDVIANNIVQNGVDKANASVGAVFLGDMEGGDPAYGDAGGHDFRLSPGSAAIDGGVAVPGVTEGYAGAAPDFGAYEFGGEDWSAGATPDSPVEAEAGAGAWTGAGAEAGLGGAEYLYRSYMKNGGFEWERVGLAAYGNMNGWERTGEKAAQVVASSGNRLAARFQDQYGLRLGTGVDGAQQVVAGLAPDTEYVLRGFARMGADGMQTDGQKVLIGVKGFGGAELSQELDSRSWREASIAFKTGPESTTAVIYALKTTEGGYAFVDDFSVALASVAASGQEPGGGGDDEDIPLFVSPVALIDDMLDESAWSVSGGAASFAASEAGGALRLEAAPGEGAYAVYGAERFGDKDFYLNLAAPESGAGNGGAGDSGDSGGNGNGGSGAGASDSAGDFSNLDMDIMLRSSALGAGSNRYEISIAGDTVYIKGFWAGEEKFRAPFPNTIAGEGGVAPLKATIRTLLEEGGINGQTVIALKCGDEIVAQYTDTSSLQVWGEGYFGIATRGAAEIRRVTETVDVGELIADRENWHSNSSMLFSEDGKSLTVYNGNALAGYYGKTFLNEEFALGFSSDLTEPACWPSLMLRASAPTSDMWAGNDAYSVVFKKDIFEIQGWKGNGSVFPIAYATNKTVLPEEIAQVRVSAVDTDYGVWIRLKAGGKLVASYMDETAALASGGYFGVIAWTPVTIYAPEPAGGEGGDPGDGGDDGPGDPDEPGDKGALASLVGNLGDIHTGIFTEESARAYAGALAGANAALGLEGATQGAIDDAAGALADALDGLALAGEYSAYGELVELLLDVARLDGREYTLASWRNLQAVAADAWAFIELATGGAQGAGASGVSGAMGAFGEGAGEGENESAGAGAGAGEGEGGELSILAADVSADVAKWLVALQEALAALEGAGSEPAAPGDKMSAGVYAGAAAVELVAEEIGESGAPALGFALKGDDIAGATTLNVRLSFRTADIADGGVEFSLPGAPENPEDGPAPGSIAAKATLRADDVKTLDPPQEPLLEGYTTYSVYILANGGETFGAEDGAALLNIALKPKAAKQALVSLILSHLDIVHEGDGGEPAIADTAIDASVAVTALRVYSRFDINRDGAVTLVDVDIVRANLGKRQADDGIWESERVARCDLSGDGEIDLADLTMAIAKYELTVG